MESLEREIAEAFTEQPTKHEPGRILIAGSPSDSRSALVTKLTERGHRCICVSGLHEAHASLARGRFDLVLMDLALRDGDGMELARSLQQTSPSTKSIVLSERKSFHKAVEALDTKPKVDTLGPDIEPLHEQPQDARLLDRGEQNVRVWLLFPIRTCLRG